MGILVDSCILGLFVLSIFMGYKKGLIGVAFKIVSFLIAILISLILYYPISNFVIEHTEIDDKIEEILVNRFSEEDISKEETEDLLTGKIEEHTNEITQNTMKIVAKNVSRTVINFGVMILIYVITRLILLVFHSISEKLAELPLVKQCNRTGGVIYGIIRGFLIIYLVFAIFVLISSLSDSSQIVNAINESFLGKNMYDNNLIVKLLF